MIGLVSCCVMACDFLHLYSFGRFTPETGEENFKYYQL